MPAWYVDVLLPAARAILAAPPADDGRRAWPHARWVPVLRKAGWPVETRTITLDADGHTSGVGRVGAVTVTAAVVPLAWLRQLAEATGARWADACRGTVD